MLRLSLPMEEKEAEELDHSVVEAEVDLALVFAATTFLRRRSRIAVAKANAGLAMCFLALAAFLGIFVELAKATPFMFG